MKKITSLLLVLTLLLGMTVNIIAKNDNTFVGINVLLNDEVTDDYVSELAKHGKVQDVLYSINALTMKVRSSEIDSIRELPFVEYANPDAIRNGSPIDTVEADTFADGLMSWNLDAINVMERDDMTYGDGVYVAVLDTGLVDAWRQYFPEERIAVEYAAAFGGGGGERGTVSTQPNKWEHDQDSHGTHVTSTILGYQMEPGFEVAGVASNATVIPVKVLNQNGSGWSSVIARGIQYVTELKKGPLADSPVVINMSLGGPQLDAIEKAAIDEAIEAGVIIVASAGNSGEVGMGYPGAYEPVISVAASGWIGEWTMPGWWSIGDVADPVSVDDFYITDFSSRQLEGQDLDIAAPGSWIVGAYSVNSGQLGFYYLGGTSMASPHVAGVVALMAEKNPSLTAAEAEVILETTALTMTAGERTIIGPSGLLETVTWGDDAVGSGLMDAKAAIDAVPAP